MPTNDNRITITATKTANIGWTSAVEAVVSLCGQMSVALSNVTIDLEGFSHIEVLNIADALSDRREREIAKFSIRVPIFSAEDMKAERYIGTKPQPFWTQQGRHKKGGRNKY